MSRVLGGQLRRRLLRMFRLPKHPNLVNHRKPFSLVPTSVNILKPGDICVGYDLRTANLNDAAYEQGQLSSKYSFPDVILVRKSYSHLRRNRRRHWRLREIAKDQEGDIPMSKADQTKAEKEYERFLEELRRMQRCVPTSIYIVLQCLWKVTLTCCLRGGDQVPKVSLEELLDDLAINED